MRARERVMGRLGFDASPTLTPRHPQRDSLITASYHLHCLRSHTDVSRRPRRSSTSMMTCPFPPLERLEPPWKTNFPLVPPNCLSWPREDDPGTPSHCEARRWLIQPARSCMLEVAMGGMCSTWGRSPIHAGDSTDHWGTQSVAF